MKFFCSKPIPILIGCLILLFGIMVTHWLAKSANSRYQVTIQSSILQQLGTVRAAAEKSLSERIYLTLGLRAYISAHPETTSAEFAKFAASLVNEGSGIRSVTLIKDNIISDVFPREGNETALGLDLLEQPDQRDDVLRAIETRKPWLSSPIKLVQGGEAFVNRAPVFETVNSREPGSGRYWGLVSILISKDVLIEDIVRGMPPNLNLAMRSKDTGGDNFTYVFGGSSIELDSPLVLKVNLPTGDWEVLGSPLKGWPEFAPITPLIWWIGGVISTSIGLLSCLLLQSNKSFRTARADAEMAVIELSRKNEDLEAFVRIASHDLKSPLRHIRHFCQFLSEDAAERINDDDLAQIKQIELSSERMTRLIDSLLQFAKTGVDAIAKNRFNTREAVEMVASQLLVQSKGKIELGDLPEVYGDQELITQVFQNLIENGLKYNTAETATVRIDSTIFDTDTVFRISDNGIGMNDSQIERAFKPGVRQVAISDYPGSGFGLAICERIVKVHGGSIWVESRPGTGSTFFLTLPNIDGSVPAAERRAAKILVGDQAANGPAYCTSKPRREVSLSSGR